MFTKHAIPPLGRDLLAAEFGAKQMRQRRQSCPKTAAVVFRIRDSRPTKCVQRDGRPIAFTQVMEPTQPVASTPELTTLRPGGSVDQTTRAAQNSNSTKTKTIKNSTEIRRAEPST